MQRPTTSKSSKPTKSNRAYLAQYAGMGMQFMAAIGLSVFAGLKADGWMKLNFPLLAWLLPLLVLSVMFYRIYKDTSARK
ncbi:MAG: AtpZ/AtpI family protein [Chitinophagaceae bacterium]|jgi:hypothetical protein|nr:AtpZ/AtpI family protein [Chitinophagaceae bacterium]